MQQIGEMTFLLWAVQHRWLSSVFICVWCVFSLQVAIKTNLLAELKRRLDVCKSDVCGAGLNRNME